MKILSVILNNVDVYLKKYAIDGNTNLICDYIAKINIDYHLKTLSNNFNFYLNDLIFYKV